MCNEGMLRKEGLFMRANNSIIIYEGNSNVPNMASFDRKRFLNYLRDVSDVAMADSTLQNYEQNLDAMINTYSLDPENPQPLDILSKMTHLSVQTLNARKYILTRLMEFNKLDIDKDLKRALGRKRHKPKRKIRSSDLITWEELVDICENTELLWLKAFYMVVFDTGRRPGAVLKLDVGDVIQTRYGYQFKFDKVKNEQGRRNVTLLIPAAIKTFENWFAVHPKRDDNEAPLFINRFGRRPTVKTIRNTLQIQHDVRLGRGSHGPKCSLFPYLFRHSRATQLLREGRLSPLEVKLRMGHKKDSQVLEQYYAILDQEDLHKAELKYLGILPKDNNIPQPIQCPNCGAINEADASLCSRCRLPLSEEALQEQTQATATQALEGLSASSELFQGLVDQLYAEILKKLQQKANETTHGS